MSEKPSAVLLTRHLSLFTAFWSGRRESNPRPTAWKAVTLPLSYSRALAETRNSKIETPLSRESRVSSFDFRVSNWWTGEGSNLRRPHGPADLQSAAFDRSATCPELQSQETGRQAPYVDVEGSRN